MSSRKSLLDVVKDSVDTTYKGSDNNIFLFAVEVDDKGFPLGRMQKIMGSPTITLGALSMIEEAVLEARKNAIAKIDLAGELSDKISDLFSKMGITDPSQIENTINNIDDPEVKRQLKEAIKKLKDQF